MFFKAVNNVALFMAFLIIKKGINNAFFGYFMRDGGAILVVNQ